MTAERIEPPRDVDERTMLLAFLERQRAAVRRKTAGLDAAQLGATLAPSDLTLGGLLAHLAYVEDWWCGVVIAGDPSRPPFDDVDWDADPDWDWHCAADRTPAELHALFEAAVARSDEVLAGIGDLDTLAARRGHDGAGTSVRWVLLHLVEEHARHVGHADLLRQSIDGEVGV